MIPLSQAMRKGAGIAPQSCRGYFGYSDNPEAPDLASDPLGAAYLGSIKPESVPHFLQFVQEMTDAVLCKSMLNKLHTKWPHLGASVRTWPCMADELEHDRLIPRVRVNQPEYRQEIHRSLWAVICDRHAAGESKAEIADFLERHGL